MHFEPDKQLIIKNYIALQFIILKLIQLIISKATTYVGLYCKQVGVMLTEVVVRSIQQFSDLFYIMSKTPMKFECV